MPFLVKVSISDLNLRKGPGTNYARTQYIPVGVYTIVEVKSGNGSIAGCGRLKSGAVSNMASYDKVIVGFPIWWGVAPRIIDTFLESYEFAGKTIIPFCTSGGSGVGRSDTALHKDVNGDVKWEKGVQINHPNEAEIKKWLDKVL